MNFKQLDLLKNSLIDWNVNYSVYPYNGYTINEVLCQFFDAINKGIVVINDYTKWVDELIKWIKAEGLGAEVEKAIDELVNSGKLEEIINNDVFGEIKHNIEVIENDIMNTNNQLNHTNKTNKKLVKSANNYLTNFKGMCVRVWETGKLETKRFKEDLVLKMNECGFNTVCLVINTYQPLYTSNNPFERVPVSYDEIDNYIKFLKEQGYKVIFKHHVELDAEGEHSWRANINPSSPTAWFNNYIEGLNKYAKICEQNNVDMFSIGSEYKALTSKYNELWVNVIHNIRLYYSGLLTYGANMQSDIDDELNQIGFWGELDIIGIDFYVDPKENVKMSVFNNTVNHRNINVLIDGVQSKYSKPTIILEYGSQILNRNEWLMNINKFFNSKKYNKGLCIWAYDQNVDNWFENDRDLCRQLKNIVYDTNVSKIYRTSEINGWQKILSCKTPKAYDEVHIKLELSRMKETWTPNLTTGLVTFKTTTTDTNKTSLTVTGNLNPGEIGYVIKDDVIILYVKIVDGYPFTFKVIDDTYMQSFELFNYQPSENVTPTTGNSNGSYTISESEEKTHMVINGFNFITGKVDGAFSNGVFEKSIEVPHVNKKVGLFANCNVVNSGDTNNVICNAMWEDDTHIKIRAKYTEGGNYGVEFSYGIICK